MNQSLHPHWHNTSDGTTANDHAVMPPVAGVTVSRRPAAVVGIGIVLVAGGLLFQGKDFFSGAQVVDDFSTTEEQLANAASSPQSSARSSSSVALPELTTETDTAAVSSAPLASSSLAFVAENHAAAPALPTNPYSYQQAPSWEPLEPTVPVYAETVPMPRTVTSVVGKGKPPRQPQTGLPLWLLMIGSIGGIGLYARISGRNEFLYK